MKAELSIKLISYFAPNCPRRIVAPNCPRRIVQRRIVLRRIVREPALTVTVLVKHPRSVLPPTVLYNLSYLQLQLQLPFLHDIMYNHISRPVHDPLRPPPQNLVVATPNPQD